MRVPDLGCVCIGGMFGIGDGWQRLVGNINEFRRVLRLTMGFCDNEGDRIAHVAHDVDGQDVARRRKYLRPIDVIEGPHKLYGLQPGSFDVIGRVDR